MTAVIGPIIAAILAPLAAYYFSKRAKTGEIKASEAAQLWEESRTIRQELRHDVDLLQKQVVELLEANENLRLKIIQLEQELKILREANEKLKKENAKLKTLIEEKAKNIPPL